MTETHHHSDPGEDNSSGTSTTATTSHVNYESTTSHCSILLNSSTRCRPPHVTDDHDHCDKNTPLSPNALPVKDKKISWPKWSTIVVVFTILTIVAAAYWSGGKTERLHNEWEQELKKYKEERKAWDRDRMSWEQSRLEHEKEWEELEHERERARNIWDATRNEWERERIEHEEELRKERKCERKEREELERQRHQELEIWDATRKEWECERIEHKEELRKERKRERKEREELERQRHQEHKVRETMRKEWEREKLEHDELEESRRKRKEKERESEERHRCEEQERREEEEKISHELYWDEVQGSDHCYAYGTREYTARLMNVPATYDGVKGCRNAPITIHDVTVGHPRKCEDRGDSEGIYGYFLVKSGEPACSPFWAAFEDKGCAAEGSAEGSRSTRRIESRLLNIFQGENWNQMCMTTPADFRGLHFESPKYCKTEGVWGVYGVWEIEDSKCWASYYAKTTKEKIKEFSSVLWK